MVHQGCVLHTNGKKSKKSTLIPPPLSINLLSVAGQEHPGPVPNLDHWLGQCSRIPGVSLEKGEAIGLLLPTVVTGQHLSVITVKT